MCFRKGNEMRAAVRFFFAWLASGAGMSELFGEMIFVITSWFSSMHQNDNRNRFFVLPFISFPPNFAFFWSGRITLHMCCRMLHSPFQNHHVLFCGNVRFCLNELWNSVSFRLFLLQVCNPCSSLCVPTFRTTPLQIRAISVSIRSVTRSHSGNALPFFPLLLFDWRGILNSCNLCLLHFFQRVLLKLRPWFCMPVS